MLGFVMMRPGVLLEAASNPTAAVADAARANDLPAVHKLIRDHADVNTPANDGSTALLWAGSPFGRGNDEGASRGGGDG